MEVNFSKLRIVKKYKPEIINVERSSERPTLYSFIRFWGRLPDYLLDDLISILKNRSRNILFDPFGGSGSVLFKGIDKRFSKIIYNDVNPVFTFITNSIFRGFYIPRDVLQEQIDLLIHRLLSSSAILDLLKMHSIHNNTSMYVHKIVFNHSITIRKKRKKTTLKFSKKELNSTAEAIIRILKRNKSISFSSLREKTIRYFKNYGKLEARVLFSSILNRLIDEGLLKKETRKDSLVLSSSIFSPKNLKILKVNKKIENILKRKERKYHSLINKNVFSYPLQYPNGIPFEKADRVKIIGDLYPPWSKILLSIIWKEVEQFEAYNEDLTNVFKVCFLASLYDASLMQMPHKSGWIIKSFWIPSPCAVKNPVYVFIKKLREFISIHSSFEKKIDKQTEVIIYNKNILDFSEEELEDKPDAVITHPPYFSTVQYGELSALWASWLGYEIPFQDEIIENYRQGKHKYAYLYMLKRSLEKIASLSKRDADIILIFQSKNQKNWELLDRIFLELPFELQQIRCYRRSSWWSSKNLFNIGNFDYALLFKNRG
jgi:hypothetical protein